MNLWFRMIRVILRAVLGKNLSPLETSRVHFRVWPHDLDINMHMNNGRYLTLMDLGRLDLMIRTGMGRLVLREKWMPVAASAMVRFRRPLLPFRSFQLESRLLCWDDKWFFLEQRLVRGGRTIAFALLKGCIRRSGGHVPPGDIFQQVLDEPLASPPMPEAVRHWIETEEDIQVPEGELS
ncbi:acyl-CoA thioesterase FadM [Natronospira proteinivora]|uniref:Acyl-CoA thioesterase FadM n=1 Tax=Natronospira proteinivora TaxID=1807133 RepID=A0ABT1G503_9GAMM|nr:thioesterase family protein [Natronospira proteinivora]MCP1726381.1 acyl-CoA thioesterase FadM [Natronospira proteinivora]